MIRWIAKAYDKPILGEIDAVGSHQFTYFDTRPYTKAEAMAIVNTLLRAKGFTITDEGRFLEVVPLRQAGPAPEHAGAGQGAGRHRSPQRG